MEIHEKPDSDAEFPMSGNFAAVCYGARSMKDLLEEELILLEGAVVERLRRGGSVPLHPTLVHAPLISPDFLLAC